MEAACSSESPDGFVKYFPIESWRRIVAKNDKVDAQWMLELCDMPLVQYVILGKQTSALAASVV